MAKVLLIEDDPLVVRMYQKILTFEGFEIDSAPDGRAGLEKVKTMKPDLIFCDVMMPKVNGIEVLERLKADPATKDIPVIMLTNLSGTHDAEVALEKGAFAYMIKSEYKPKDVAQKAKEFFSHTAGGKQGGAAQQAPQPVPQQTPAANAPAAAAPVVGKTDEATVRPESGAPVVGEDTGKVIPPGK